MELDSTVSKEATVITETTPEDDVPKWDGQIKSCICHAQVQVLTV